LLLPSRCRRFIWWANEDDWVAPSSPFLNFQSTASCQCCERHMPCISCTCCFAFYAEVIACLSYLLVQ
jgi:hypothetical protein